MSMHDFLKPEWILSREEAINAIITSISMQEKALSHLIDAESKKIKFAIEHLETEDDCKAIQKLLEVNESAASLIDRVTDLEIVLKNKLRLVTNCVPPKPPCPPPKPPCPPPRPPCRPHSTPCRPHKPPSRPHGTPCRPHTRAEEYSDMRSFK